jgi:predicted TIM-barrel fold metal-dependent hydrolase
VDGIAAVPGAQEPGGGFRAERYRAAKAAGGMLSGKVLFGSDYPLITPERWLDDFAGLDLRAEVLPGIFKGNACKILGLA